MARRIEKPRTTRNHVCKRYSEKQLRERIENSTIRIEETDKQNNGTEQGTDI